METPFFIYTSHIIPIGGRIMEKKVLFLLDILKQYDTETSLHSLRVADITLKLIKNESFTIEDKRKIYYAALLHDIGKLKVRSDVLFKESFYTESDYNEMKKHSKYGYEIILKELNDEKIARIVLEHHEREDGSGYPYNKKNFDILIESKIIAIADSYDAMKSKRRYKRELRLDEIQNEFLTKKEQYDKYYLEKLLKSCKEK